jgi:hypothetical protein
MMQHGMGAFGATGRAGGGISAGFVAATAWSEVLNDYAKFIDTPSFWVTRQERNNPANFPTLLKAMESRCLSELDSGRAGDVGRQKLRAVVVGFDFKAADPTLALLDARDAMRAIVATANSTPPASEEVKAFEAYKAKAEQGDSDAQTHLGLYYSLGDGVAKDKVEAVKWHRKAAEQGNRHGLDSLRISYFAGSPLEKGEVLKVVQLFRMAADKGDVLAQSNMGYCYHYGLGVLKDPTEEAKWYRKAAEQGNVTAQNHLGICYLYGVVRDEIEAYAYFNLASGFNLASSTYEDAGKIKGMLEEIDDARKYRDKLEKRLSPDDVLRGRKRTLELQKEIDAKSAAKKAGK